MRMRRNGKSVLPSNNPKATPTIVASAEVKKDNSRLCAIGTACCLLVVSNASYALALKPPFTKKRIGDHHKDAAKAR